MQRIITAFLFLVVPTITFAQANKTVNIQEKLKAIANGYYMAYNSHNTDKILKYYADDAILIDEVLDHTLTGKKEFRRVSDEAFHGPQQVFKNLKFDVYSMEQKGYNLTVKGEMKRVEWTEGAPENWTFTTYLTFNEQGRIIKQRDYVDYPDYVKADVAMMRKIKKERAKKK